MENITGLLRSARNDEVPCCASNETILTVENLNAYYPAAGRGKPRRQIIHDVSFSLASGEILGLVGASGSGKTTLVKTILGIVKDYEGEIHHYSRRPQMVFQDPYSSLNPVRRIGWILEEPLRIAGGYSKEERREAVLAMLEKVGLGEEFAARLPRELSGGQRQRVSIAAALMQRPRLLVADEPVSALDIAIQTQILELLQKLHNEMGLAIIFISHDLRVVKRLCGRIMVLHEGAVCEEGESAAIFANPQAEYTRRLIEAAVAHL
jgi:peptide/nickel transport system ATP-binding protein